LQTNPGVNSKVALKISPQRVSLGTDVLIPRSGDRTPTEIGKSGQQGSEGRNGSRKKAMRERESYFEMQAHEKWGELQE